MSQEVYPTAAQALAYHVECSIATLEGLLMVKRSSKSELRRHESIVRNGLANCRAHVSVEDAKAARATRVKEWLEGKRNETGGREER